MNREHVVLLDRSGYDLYRHPDGAPFFDPDRYRITLLTHPDKTGAAAPGEVETEIVVNVLDEQAVLGVLPRLAAGPPVDHVVAVSERLLLLAGHFRDVLGVAGYSTPQMQVLRHKAVMKRHMAAQGIRVPDFVEVRRPLDAAPLLERHGALILKPLLSMGSVGVHEVSSRTALQALESSGFSADGPYEAEEFICGPLFTIDSVVVAGRPSVALVSRYLDDNSTFPLGGQCRCVNIDPGPVHDALLDFNRRVLSTVGWFSGVTHLEAFLDVTGTPVFCEIAGRPGGGGVVPSFRHRYGVDLNLLAALPQLGRPLPTLPEVQPPDRRSCGDSVIYPPATGIVRSFEADLDEDWVVQFTQIKHVGDVLVPSTSYGQGVAVVTVCGPDSGTVGRRLDEVRRRVRLRVEPYVGQERLSA